MDKDNSKLETTKDVTDYDQPSLVTPQPGQTMNQTATSAFGSTQGPHREPTMTEVARDTRMKAKHKQRKQLNKTFTDFKTSPMGQAERKRKGFLVHVDTQYNKTPNPGAATSETNRDANRSQVSAEM